MTPGEPEKRARDARSRTYDKRYDTELKERGFADVGKTGMVFSGDRVRAVFK